MPDPVGNYADSEPYVGGVLNQGGAYPGKAYKFAEPVFPGQICYTLKFESTYEAIEKLILPPPLKVDRSMPPEVIVWYFFSPGARGPGGQPCPYQGFQFRGWTEVNGIKGNAGWEYVDGWKGDKTYADVMSTWGIQFGMLKKFANINFYPLGGDRFQVTAERQGHLLAKMTISIGEELKGSDFKDVAHPDSPFNKPTFTVREVPNHNYSGFSDHSINLVPSNKTNKVLRAWSAHSASIEFGNQPMDPMTELQPRNTTAMGVSEVETYKGTFTDVEVVARL